MDLIFNLVCAMLMTISRGFYFFFFVISFSCKKFLAQDDRLRYLDLGLVEKILRHYFMFDLNKLSWAHLHLNLISTTFLIVNCDFQEMYLRIH